MNTFPADEQRIWEVERGRSYEAIVPLAVGNLLSAGDTVLFALSSSRAGQQPSYVKGGDSVQVILTDVVPLGSFDPISGHPLYRLFWEPLGQPKTEPTLPKRTAKVRRPIPQA